jgi:hypothetical protein
MTGEKIVIKQVRKLENKERKLNSTIKENWLRQVEKQIKNVVAKTYECLQVETNWKDR